MNLLIQVKVESRNEPHEFVNLKYPACSHIHVQPAFKVQSDAHPTGDQEVVGLIPVWSGILSCSLIMKYFLRSFFFPFC